MTLLNILFYKRFNAFDLFTYSIMLSAMNAEMIGWVGSIVCLMVSAAISVTCERVIAHNQTLAGKQ